MEPYQPMLAVPATARDLASASVAGGWCAEFKWDGVRAIAGVEDRQLRLWSRNLADVTPAYPELAGLAEVVPDGTWLDGEIVAFDASGRPSFARLQGRMHLRAPARVAAARSAVPVAYLVFDVLRLAGEELLQVPYETRRQRLVDMRLAGSSWQVPPSHENLQTALQVAHDMGLEGIVAKRLDSPYRPGVRSPDWRKLRLMLQQEFVVGGYRAGKGGRSGTLGSLAVGYYEDDGRLVYAGNVGSGLTDKELDELRALLDDITVDRPPFDPAPAFDDITWVEPSVVVEVRFAEWTPDGQLRQPTYLGRRDDKSPRDVVREEP